MKVESARAMAIASKGCVMRAHRRNGDRMTLDQVNDFLPEEVSSSTDLRSALQSFEDMHIKVLDEVPADGTEGELETEVKGPDEAAATVESIGESSDPVRLYLKEMSNFPLLSREQEVEIAKLIEAGAHAVDPSPPFTPSALTFALFGVSIKPGQFQTGSMRV